MDILKEGLLYLHGVKFGKKTWRKIWMIILQPQTLEIGRLEVYSLPDDVTDDMLPPLPDKTKRRVVLLSDCLSITLAPEEACPSGCTAFYLDTTLRTYTLASEVCQAWLLALCQLTFQDPGDEDQENGLLMKDNELYSGFGDLPEQYRVTVVDTQASERCLLAGDFTFLLDREAAFLLDQDTADIIYRWPYIFLRRFGILKGGFCIEAGHQCDSGEGMFSFLSRHGHQVCQAIGSQCLTEQEAMGSLADEGPDRSPPTETRDQIPPESPNIVYSLVGFPETDRSASPHQSVRAVAGAAGADGAAGHSLTPPLPPPNPQRRDQLSTKGRKTKTAGGPVERSPSGPQNGPPLSFKQKLSELISIDLAKVQFPRRFRKGKS
ncbi:hypothetical protein NHX12_011645 [Muraenolepis orangiensis]|uniref:IRS-type PTB domain-containing protein n=1 Tax=Muraenolepis orangiensis TaxID=630683 RepID=A0A9Q0DGS2_9TELE|nr:hypothetical protein NHX12_011645 [Muraenolepis orangiensis]